MLFTFLILAATVLAQPSPPAWGVQIGPGHPDSGIDVRFPLTVTQCEPVFIFYNNTSSSLIRVGVFLGTDNENFLSLYPTDAGYMEWICNIPAGFGFWATAIRLDSVVNPMRWYHVVVQTGLSSSCLHDVTTRYEYALYNTTVFESYTAHPPITTAVSLLSDHLATSTVPFPAGFSTITVNPELIISTQTSLAPSPSRHKPNSMVIFGGVFGGIVVVVVVVYGVVWIRFRMSTHPTTTRRGGSRRSYRTESTNSNARVSAAYPNSTHQLRRSAKDSSIQHSSTTSPSTRRASNTIAPVSTRRPTSMPAKNSTIPLNLDRSKRNSNPSSRTAADAVTRPAQTGGPLFADMFSTPDPHVNTHLRPPQTPQIHESMHPELAGQPLHSATASLQAPPTRPAPAPEVTPTSDKAATALAIFSQLPPEQMRTLFPVLETVMAAQHPPEPSGGHSVPSAPPL